MVCRKRSSRQRVMSNNGGTSFDASMDSTAVVMKGAREVMDGLGGQASKQAGSLPWLWMDDNEREKESRVSCASPGARNGNY